MAAAGGVTEDSGIWKAIRDENPKSAIQQILEAADGAEAKASLLNSRNDKGLTPLAFAVIHKKPDAVKELLCQGANPIGLSEESTTGAGGSGKTFTPLYQALRQQSCDIAKLLVDAQTKEQLNQDQHDGGTAVFWAAHFARPEPLASMLEKGADVNKQRNTENNTNSPLHEASARCAKCVILLLGVPNIDVTATNKDGKTPAQVQHADVKFDFLLSQLKYIAAPGARVASLTDSNQSLNEKAASAQLKAQQERRDLLRREKQHKAEASEALHKVQQELLQTSKDKGDMQLHMLSTIVELARKAQCEQARKAALEKTRELTRGTPGTSMSSPTARDKMPPQGGGTGTHVQQQDPISATAAGSQVPAVGSIADADGAVPDTTKYPGLPAGVPQSAWLVGENGHTTLKITGGNDASNAELCALLSRKRYEECAQVVQDRGMARWGRRLARVGANLTQHYPAVSALGAEGDEDEQSTESVDRISKCDLSSEALSLIDGGKLRVVDPEPECPSYHQVSQESEYPREGGTRRGARGASLEGHSAEGTSESGGSAATCGASESKEADEEDAGIPAADSQSIREERSAQARPIGTEHEARHRQGLSVTELRFAVEAGPQPGVDESETYNDANEDGRWYTGFQGIMSVQLPVGGADFVVNEDLARRYIRDKLIRVALGERMHRSDTDRSESVVCRGCHFIQRVISSWMAPAQIMLPYLRKRNERECATQCKAIYCIEERFPATLDQVVEECRKENSKLSARQLGVWFLQMLMACKHMLQRGVVHSDIRPENIGLTPDGRALLFNFEHAMFLYQGGLRADVDKATDELVSRLKICVDSAPTSASSSIRDSSSPLSSEGSVGDADGSVGSEADAQLDRANDIGFGLRAMHPSEMQPEHADEEPLYEGCRGREARPVAYSPDLFERRDDTPWAPWLPEVARLRDSGGFGVNDAASRPIKQAAQAAGPTDMYQAAVVFYNTILRQSTHEGALFDGKGTIPDVPDDAWAEQRRPVEFEAILRGCMQPNPAHRLPLEHAIQAMVALLYGCEDMDDVAKTSADTKEGRNRMQAWVRNQRILLAKAELALPPIPIEAIVGPFLAQKRRDKYAGCDPLFSRSTPRPEEDGSNGAAGPGADMGKGSDAAQAPGSGDGAEARCPHVHGESSAARVRASPKKDADSMLEAVLGRSSGIQPILDRSRDGTPQTIPSIDGMAHGIVGRHIRQPFAAHDVGAGIAEGRLEWNRAQIRSKVQSVVASPGMSIRSMYGCCTGLEKFDVIPLPVGTTSLWGHQHRRFYFSLNGAEEYFRDCFRSLILAFECYGTNREEETAGWTGTRSMRWIPGGQDDAGSSEAGPATGGAGPLNSGAKKYKDGRDLPPGYVAMPPAFGKTFYIKEGMPSPVAEIPESEFPQPAPQSGGSGPPKKEAPTETVVQPPAGGGDGPAGLQACAQARDLDSYRV